MVIIFITSILKSLVVPVIWLALIGAIYSRIAPFFTLNRIFFPANEKVTLNTKQPIGFQGLFIVTNQIAVKWKTKSLFCNFCFQNSYPPQKKKWMNLISSSFWMMTMRSFSWRPTFHGLSHFSCTFWWIFWRFSTFSSSKSTRSRVHRVSNERRKSKATTRVRCFKISYHFKRWNTWAQVCRFE